MAHLIGRQHYGKVSDFLKSKLPESVVVYHVLQRLIEGRDPGYNVWSSEDIQSPKYNVIVISADPQRCKNPFYRQFVHLYCTDPTAIVKTLSAPGVVNVNEKLLLYEISVTDMQYVSTMEFMKEYQQSVSCITHRLWCTDERRISKSELPDNFKTSEMTIADVKNLVETSFLTDRDGLYEVELDLVRWQFPSVCIHNEEGESVARGRQSFWGEQGGLFVNEKYRRKGLAKYITSHLAGQIIRREGLVYTCVDDGNEASDKVHEAVGFKRDGLQNYYTVECVLITSVVT